MNVVRTARRALAAASLSLALLPAAHAGQTCDAPPLGRTQVAQALDLACRIAQRLDALAAQNGTQVVLLARQGRNLDEWGLSWSHLAFAYRDDAAQAWRVVHKLNACGTAVGQLHRQGLAPFFLDDLHRYRAGLVPLAPAVQQALLPLLRDNTRAATLQHAPYSMVAHPASTRYQQSNQWALETLAMAVEPTITDRNRAQAWLRFKGYQPTVLRVNALQRLGARVGTAHIAFDDHPNADRYADRIATVTVESVFRFVQEQKLGGALEVLN